MDVWLLVASGFTLVAVTLSFYEVLGHLCNFTKPYLQRYIIRILLMVPIYSMNAWIALVFPSTGLYLDSLREVYESFVIYSFMKYLMNFLQYDTNLQQYIDHKPGPSHIFPLCFLPTCVGGRKFIVKCKHGILQYVVVRPITTSIAFISQLFDFYGEGNYNPLSGNTYPVLLIINNVSQIMAMYCLVIFYSGYRHELDPMGPLAKFFSIKLVVFFSFFQSVVISSLLEIAYVETQLGYLFPDINDKVSLGRKIQELLICFDMMVAACGHLFAFPYRPFIEEDDRGRLIRGSSAPNGLEDETSANCCQAFCNLLDFADEKSDVKEHFGQIFSKIKYVFTVSPPLPSIVSNTNQESNDWLNYSCISNSTSGQSNQAMKSIKRQSSKTNGTTTNLNTKSKSYKTVDV